MAGSANQIVYKNASNVATGSNNFLFLNDSTLIVGAATSTETASQPLQVTGGAYVSGSVGIGTTNPTSKLTVQGDVLVSGVVTATSFSGNLKGGLTGNVIYQSAPDTTAFLVNGTSGFVLQSNGIGNFPTWVAAAPSGAVSGITVRDSSNNIIGTSGSVTQLTFGTGLSVTGTTGAAGIATITLSSNIVGSALSISGIATVGFITATNLYVSGVGTFLSSGLKIRNPANTFGYTITADAIAADRTLTLPLITGTDTIAVLGLNQTFSGSINFSNTLQASGGSQVLLAGSASLSHEFGTNQTSANLTFGGTSGSGLITFGRSTASQQTDIQAGITASGNTKTINFGTGGASGSFTKINIGPTAGVGTVVVNSGTNLGVGSISPAVPLDVVGNAKFTGIVTATSFSGSGTNLTGIVTSIVAGTNITVSGSTGQVTINSSGVSISTNTTNQNQFIPYATGTGNTTGLGVSTTGLVFNPSSGNVGIATTNPLQKLHVLGNLLVAAGSSTGQHITQKAYELNSGTLSWEGSAGQLFSITNNLTSGSIFSVNDVSGIPSIDVNANGTVSMVSYGGNLGIGTTNPTSKLHVVGNVNISGISTLGVTSATNLTAQQLNVSGLSTFAGITTHTAALFGTQASFTGIVTATQLDLTASASANDSVLYLSGTPTSSSGTNGLFGIGALSFSDTDIIADFTHSVNSYAQLVVQNKNSGSSSSADIIVNNDRSAGTTYYGDFGINGTTFAGGGPFGDVDGTYLYSAGGTLSLGSLNAHNVKIATNNTERITILSTGNVGVGTTNPTSKLYIVGDTYVTGVITATTYYGSGANLTGLTAGVSISTNTTNQTQYLTYVTGTGSTTGFGITTTGLTFNPSTGNMVVSGTVTANSDEKLKTNIQTIPNALEKVLSLRGVEYDRIDTLEHQIGVIAQEVEKIIPEVVYPKQPAPNYETKSVAYANLIGLLIEAIKEQNVRIEELERRLGEL